MARPLEARECDAWVAECLSLLAPVVLVCVSPSFLLSGLLSWAKSEVFLLKFLGSPLVTSMLAAHAWNIKYG